MNDRDTRIRRILIALDSSVSPPDTLEVAADLARRLRAELEGLFVEDNELLQLSALPFTSQVNLTTGGRQPLNTAELEVQMANLAEGARRRLEAIAKRDRVAWSFRKVRGRIAQEIATAAETADLVIIEGGHHGGPAYARIGLPATATVKRITRSVLILRHGRRFDGTVYVVFDGTPQSEKALKMAASLAPTHEMLTILLPEKAQTDRSALEAQARALLGDGDEEIRAESFAAETLGGLCGHIGRSEAGLLVMGADSPLLPDRDVAGLLDSITCTVLLVR